MLDSPEFRKKVQSHLEKVSAQEEAARTKAAAEKLARDIAEQHARERIAAIIELAGEVAVAASRAAIPHNVRLSMPVYAGVLRRPKQEHITSGWKIYSSTSVSLIGEGYQSSSQETTSEVVLGNDGALYEYTHFGKSKGTQVSVENCSPVTVDGYLRHELAILEDLQAGSSRGIRLLESHLVQFVADSESLTAQMGLKP
jgi:hypothetical protein